MSKLQRVVSIDDNRLNLILIESMLANMNVDIISFLNPAEAFEYCTKESADLILVDYMMPELDGISFIKNFRKKDQEIPIIMVTAVDDDDNIKVSALESGATEFLTKPLKLYEFQVRIKNLLALRRNQMLLKDRAAHLQREVEEATRLIVHREIETLAILGRASEYKDTETGAHISRVAMYARLIGSELIDSPEEVEVLFFSTPLHDVGKIGIPDSIMLKPGKLDDDEFEVMKTHTSIGYELLSDSKSKYLQAGALIANTHHEKWNGKGYPAGLRGRDIPLFGRIVAVCDVLDALMSARPYKAPWSFEDSCSYIIENSGEMFDPDVVEVFRNKLSEIREISEKYKDS